MAAIDWPLDAVAAARHHFVPALPVFENEQPAGSPSSPA
jgi:hypothetical protein